MVALITYIVRICCFDRSVSKINAQSGFDRISSSYPRVFLRRLNHVVWQTSPQWSADRAIAKYMAFFSPYRCLQIIIVISGLSSSYRLQDSCCHSCSLICAHAW